jgi:2-dehydro-3-deoxygluconokinase
MKKVLCFGEILLRLSPDLSGKWLQQQMMPAFIGGAELNVANALACWQTPIAYCSALPDNYMSKEITKNLIGKGIDMSRMITAGSRIGIYFLAQGTDLKNAEVIYDRALSSTATLKPGTINWDEIFEEITWFHFTAITPAISEDLALICIEALEAATKKNITISVDLNYRSKLWKWGKHPAEVMPGLVKYCHVVMGNIWAAEMMLGIGIDNDFIKEKDASLKQSSKTSQELIKRFPLCGQVAHTFRYDQGDSLQYYATLYSNDGMFVSGEHKAVNIADKVGSGDCFMAGLIYGNINGQSEQETIDFAAAAAVDKMFIVGDATTSGVEEVRRRQKR